MSFFSCEWAVKSVVVKLEEPPLYKDRPWIVSIEDPWDHEFLMIVSREKTEKLAYDQAGCVELTLTSLYSSLWDFATEGRMDDC